MVLSGEWKNKVRLMRSCGDDEGAKKELMKARIMWYDNLEECSDKFFIDYCLAHHCYKEKDFNMCNKYLNEIESIFEDYKNIDSMQKEYCNYLWLNVNVNYNKLDIRDVIKDMNYVYEYYMCIKEKDIAISALINIFRFEGERSEDKILYSLKELLKCNNISDWNFVNSILNDCEEINHSLYIRALNIVNDYRKFNIDIV